MSDERTYWAGRPDFDDGDVTPPPRSSVDRALAAARQPSPQDYLSQHMRAWSKVDPAAVARVLLASSLSSDDLTFVASELGVTL